MKLNGMILLCLVIFVILVAQVTKNQSREEIRKECERVENVIQNQLIAIEIKLELIKLRQKLDMPKRGNFDALDKLNDWKKGFDAPEQFGPLNWKQKIKDLEDQREDVKNLRKHFEQFLWKTDD